MKTLRSLLERFTRSLGRDELTRGAAAGCIKETLGFEVPMDDISIKGDTLVIKTSPAKKNEIKLNEIQLLQEIQNRCQIKLSRILYIGG